MTTTRNKCSFVQHRLNVRGHKCHFVWLHLCGEKIIYTIFLIISIALFVVFVFIYHLETIFGAKKLHSKDKIKRTTHQWACDASKFTQTWMKCGILGNSLMMHTYRRNGFGSACVLRGVRNSAKKISYPAYFLYIIIYNFFFRI